MRKSLCRLSDCRVCGSSYNLMRMHCVICGASYIMLHGVIEAVNLNVTPPRKMVSGLSRVSIVRYNDAMVRINVPRVTDLATRSTIDGSLTLAR